MHVTSEEGVYTFRKTLRKQSKLHERINLIESNVDDSESVVCGIYFMTDPDKLVEVEVEFSDVSCELGGLLGVTKNFFITSFDVIRHLNIFILIIFYFFC